MTKIINNKVTLPQEVIKLNGFNIGDKVYLKAEPAVQRALYHVRFHGKAGVILNKRGRCYEVLIKDFNADKKLIIHPVHMEKR